MFNIKAPKSNIAYIDYYTTDTTVILPGFLYYLLYASGYIFFVFI